jgi:Thioredoxin like C-terminal domain/AhpC/TSA family
MSDATSKFPWAPVADLPIEGHFPSLEGASGWLNSGPLTAAGLRGRVVAVDFCTYTCINWIRSLPYVRAWAETYEDQGLVVIGVHTPEFSFERDVENIRRALDNMRVEYPIAIDSDYGVWNAFANHYWPALYLIDAEGRIRHHRFGEGDYDRSEVIIRQLLADAGADEIGEGFAPVDPRGPEVQADWDSLETAETYLGYRQTQNFASPGGVTSDVPRQYERPEMLRRNHWALSGDWTMRGDAAALNEPNGRIAFRFHARDVHLVMGPHDREHPIGFRVTVDGEPLGGARGTDVDADGSGTLIEQRMYQLIRQPRPIVDRVFEIEFLASGVEGFAFTFG